MKLPFFIQTCLLLSLALGTSPAASAADIHETEEWFVVVHDWDSDTAPDVTLVGRATGLVRTGLGAGGNLSWLAEKSLGTFLPTSVAVGDLNGIGDWLLAASAASNAITAVDASGTGAPFFINAAGPDPQEITVVDLPGVGTPGADNLAAAHPYGLPGVNGPAWSLLEDAATAAPGSPLAAAPGQGRLDQLRVVGVTAGGQPFAAAMDTGAAGGVALRILTANGAAAPVPLATAGTLPFHPSAARWTAAEFGTAGTRQFIVYAENQSELFFYELPVTPVTGPLAAMFGGVAVPVTDPVRQVLVLEESGQKGLLVIFTDGTTAVFDFDGTLQPALRAANLGSSLARFAAPLPGGGFWLGETDANGTLQLARYDYDPAGHGYTRGTVSTVPQSAHKGGTNLLVFDGEPFVASQPVAVARLRDGDWTANPATGSLPVSFTAQLSTFGGAAAGLTGSGTVSFSNPAPQGTHVLANQYRPDASFTFGSAPSGENRGRVIASPEGGLFTSAVEVVLSLADGAAGTIHYQVNGGDWTAYAGAPIGPLLADTTLRFFADAGGGVRTPIGQAVFGFDLPPGTTLDSNGDGMPDWLKLDLGLDPLGKIDSDGDTFSDLEEALQGTDATDAGSSPAESVFARVLSTFDAVISADFPDGAAHRRPLPATTPGEDPAPELRAFDFIPAQIGAALFETHAEPGVASPAAFLNGIDAPPPNLPVAVAWEDPMPLATLPESITGAALAALLCPPPAVPPGLLFEPVGATPAERIAHWRAQATAALEAARVKVVREITPVDTLAFVLSEHVLGTAMHAAGIVAIPQISLMPFRDESAVPNAEIVDQGGTPALVPRRVAVTENELLVLRDGAPGSGAGALDVKGTIDRIHAALLDPLDPSFAATAPLRDLVSQLYDLQLNPPTAIGEDPPVYIHPIEILRRFVIDGQLEPVTLAAIPMDETGVAQAHAAFAALAAAAPVSRPVLTLQVQTTPASRFTAVPVAVATVSPPGQAVALFPSPAFSTTLAALNPVAGTRFSVTGLRSLTIPAGFDDAVDVITGTLATLPAPTVVDADGNGLDDAWERAVLGRLGGNSAANDSDGDGFSDMQEMLEGTNALDAASVPATAAFPTVLPAAANGQQPPGGGAGQIVLQVAFPSVYADRVRLEVFANVDLLSTSWTPTGVSATPVGPNLWEATLTQSGDRRFYIVRVLPK